MIYRINDTYGSLPEVRNLGQTYDYIKSIPDIILYFESSFIFFFNLHTNKHSFNPPPIKINEGISLAYTL